MNGRIRRMRRRLTQEYALRAKALPPERGLSMTRLRRATAKRVLNPTADERWSRVQELLREETARMDAESGTEKRQLFEAMCHPPVDPAELCARFHIEARTFYAWRTEILGAAMLIAAEEGYLSLVRREIL